MKMTARRFLTVASLIVFVFAVFALPASANHSWGNYHWARTANPFTVKLGDNVTSQWDSYLKTASTDWSKSSVLDTVIVAGGTTGKRCAATAGRVEICNDTYGYNGWLGVAQIWASGSHITQSIVKMNDSYFNTATYNTSAWRNLVMCQEVGHAFGLDHQDENFDNANLGTCMDYTNDPSSNQHPNQHDYNQLESIYSHLDSTNTAFLIPEAVANGNFHAQSEWGKMVKVEHDGRSALYERDFGNGIKVFTHVFWAAEGPGRP